MKENQLIFLISQSGSASTLAQKIIEAHSNVCARSDPWLMMHPSYSLKDKGIYAEYDFELGRNALDNFLVDLPEGRLTYINEIKKAYLNLYGYYIDGSSCKYFLDKTPRYYLVINELLEMFPEANYVLFLRNPLAVLGSIINSWEKQNWYNLSSYKNDLVQSIDAFIDVLDNRDSGFVVVRHEDLVLDDENIISGICKHIGLASEKEEIEGNHKPVDSVNASKEEVDQYYDEPDWQGQLNNAQYWRVMYDYLHYIGEERLRKLGYNFAENLAILEQNMPALSIKVIHEKTFPLFSFFDETRECLISNQIQQEAINEKNEQLVCKEEIIKQKNDELEQKESVIRNKNDELEQKNNELKRLYAVINKKNDELQVKSAALEEVESESEYLNVRYLALEEKFYQDDLYITEFNKINNNNRRVMGEVKGLYEVVGNRYKLLDTRCKNLDEKYKVLEHKYKLLSGKSRNVTRCAAKLLSVSTTYHPIDNARSFKRSIMDLHHLILKLNS